MEHDCYDNNRKESEIQIEKESPDVHKEMILYYHLCFFQLIEISLNSIWLVTYP